MFKEVVGKNTNQSDGLHRGCKKAASIQRQDNYRFVLKMLLPKWNRKKDRS
uniref:Uncharacterized protein n=1 Tax=Arion vulgaris TaxID=1028688 RepID=A0A0B7AF52_9EUPU